MRNLSYKHTFQKLFILSTLSGASLASFAGAGTSLMQTAPVLAPGQYELKVQTDIILNQGGGLNISPHLRLGLLEHYLDIETFLGTGTTDFQMGAIAKYNILPDLDGQVGLSILLGFSYIRDFQRSVNTSHSVALTTFGLVASKQVAASYGKVTPYAALEVESFVAKNDSRAPITLIGGAKWDLDGHKLGFYSELGMNIHQSFWSLSAGASYPF